MRCSAVLADTYAYENCAARIIQNDRVRAASASSNPGTSSAGAAPGIVVRAPTCGDRLRTIRTVIGIATTIIGIASATLRLDGKFTFLRCTVRRRLRDAQQQINARIPSQGA